MTSATVEVPVVDQRPTVVPARRRRLPVWATVIGWVVVVPLAVVAVLRLVAWDRTDVLALVNTATPVVYLPAWIVAVAAVVGRRTVLAVAAVLVVVAQIVFLLPEILAAEPVPPWAARAPTLSLLDANVWNENHSMAGYATQIESTRPDLVTLEEATPFEVAQLDRSGALARLPDQVEVRRPDQKAFLVASRYPLSDTHLVTYGASPFIVQTVIHLPWGRQDLWVVHTTAPLPEAFAEWQGQLALIARLVRAHGPTGLLVVGDFNATWGTRGFRTILDTGLTDAAAARGHPFAMTWLQTGFPLPEFVRIDHVLTGGRVAVTRIATGPGPGSDHRDLHATVAFER